MGVFNAMMTAVTGLSAQSYALENISGNIANSQTVGFKRVDTSFVDLIPDQAARHENAGSVAAYSQLTNTLQGTFKTTGVPTNLALNGNGYFVVQSNTGSTTAPTFNGQDLYTRRGDFTSDANGYLVNGAGKYLVGQTGQPIKLSSEPVAAKQTNAISYASNLPSYPKTATADPTVSGSELMSPGLASSATISGTDRSTFEGQTISGGQVTIYDEAGAPVTMQTRWGKTASASSGSQDTWQLYYENSSAASGTATAYSQVGGAFTFTPNGTLTSAGAVTIPSITVNGATVSNITLNVGSGKLTQYGDTSGQVSNSSISQDGYQSGTLSSLSVSSDGQISGNYSNGRTAKMAQVEVAHFKADDMLKRMDGGTYAQTVESGEPAYGLQGASLSSGSVESSNTDIAEEFSKMIVTQQAYSANTRVISTAQQMLQDVINVIR